MTCMNKFYIIQKFRYLFLFSRKIRIVIIKIVFSINTCVLFILLKIRNIIGIKNKLKMGRVRFVGRNIL